MVPSFLAPSLIRAKADGRLPAISRSVRRSRNSFTGASAAVLRQAGALHSPALRRELAAESPAHVLLMHVDIRRRNFDAPWPASPAMSETDWVEGQNSTRVSLPCDHLPVRLEAGSA